VGEQPIDTTNIQGNIVGFNKDHEAFILLALPDDEAQAKGWLDEITDDVATADEVKRFNALFKLVRSRRHREGTVQATWMNIAFTASGLRRLGAAQSDIDLFSQEFREGMRSRAVQIGDMGVNAREHWVAGLGDAQSTR
jgi:hypothetical protein